MGKTFQMPGSKPTVPTVATTNKAYNTFRGVLDLFYWGTCTQYKSAVPSKILNLTFNNLLY